MNNKDFVVDFNKVCPTKSVENCETEQDRSHDSRLGGRQVAKSQGGKETLELS